jgi:hypothetical protein
MARPDLNSERAGDGRQRNIGGQASKAMRRAAICANTLTSFRNSLRGVFSCRSFFSAY